MAGGLHDHVRGNVGLRQRCEDRRRDAGTVWNADHGEPGDVLLMRDAPHTISVFHDRLLRTNDGTRPGVKARSHM